MKDFVPKIWKCQISHRIFAPMQIDTEFLQRFGKLSQLEISIMQQIAGDIPKTRIADNSGLTVKQIYSKIEGIKKKLNVKTASAALILMHKNKLIE